MDKITIMWRDIPQLEIQLTRPRPTVKKLVDKPRRFIIPESLYDGSITYHILDNFLCSRLPDKHRADIDYILKKYDLKYFNPYIMCSMSHGRNMNDFVWMKFDDEQVTFDEVRLGLR